MTALAQIPFPSEPILNNFIWGLGGLLLIALLVLSVIYFWKQVFGRQPSLNSTISGLITHGAFTEFKKEMHIRCRGLEEQISKMRHDVDAALNTAFVAAELRGGVITMMRDQVSRLQERTETHIRKLDQYDLKLDTLIRELPRALRAANGH
jgi:hypothetical protein